MNARSTAREPRGGAARTQNAPNEFVQLAADLGSCMAFEPKRWKQVLAKSTTVLNSNNISNTARRRADQQQYQHAAKKRPLATSNNSSRPSSRDEDAVAVVLPSVYPDQNQQRRQTLSLSEYLNQPAMVRAILEEADAETQECAARDPDRSEDGLHESADDTAPPTDTELVSGIAELDSKLEACTQQQSGDALAHATSTTIASLLLPLLKTVSPRTRQGLARLPPPSSDDLQEIQEMEDFAGNKHLSRNFYQALKKQRLQLKRQSHRQPQQQRRPAQRTVPLGKLENHSRSSSSLTGQPKSSPKPKSPVKSGMRDEQIHMVMEDFNANHLEIPAQLPAALHPDTKEARSHADCSPANHFYYQQLLHEKKSAESHEQVAQSHVDHTITEIRQFLPLELIYTFGKGTFASPAQQRATEVLFRVGSRLKSNLIIQAMQQWKQVVAHQQFQEMATAALCLQCWWRQVLAAQELRARRRIRFELQKRQQALVRMLASKQNKSASIITNAMRSYAHRKRRHRVVVQCDAAKKIQKFWRERQAFWVALRIQLRKQQRTDAAVRIQKHVRGRQARLRRRLLLKIRRVELKRVETARLKRERRHMLQTQGAAILIQRAFRKWQQRRVLALRRRRAQFERDKVKIVKVQAQYRGQKARKFFIRHLLEVHNAVPTIQRAWRCSQARQERSRLQDRRDEQRRKWIEEIDEHRKRHKNRVVVSQQVKKTWNQIMTIKDKVAISGLVNGSSSSSSGGPSPQEVHAAMKLQARWRGIKIRQRLRHEKARERELQRRSYNRARKRAATCIQKRVRGILGRARAWGLVVHRSAARIQSAWRGIRTRRELVRMQKALQALQKMQIQWRQRRSAEFQRQRTLAVTRIQKRARVYLGRHWLRKMVRRQQFLAEEQAVGKVLMEGTRRRIKDELLLQSFVFKELAVAASDPQQDDSAGDGEDDSKRVDRSLLRLDRAKAAWTRKGYDGVWQEVFRNASGGAAEIDSSHFARFLKALPHSFVNKTSFPTQTVDLIFTKMKEPKARSISFARFNKAMGMVWQEKFEPAVASDRAAKSDPKAAAVAVSASTADQTRYLKFMNQFLLPSTLHSGKYRKMLDEQCTQRVLWSVAVLRRFANRIASRKFHDHFLVIYKERQVRKRQVVSANSIQVCYRRHKFRVQMKTTLAQMFAEYVDHRGRPAHFKHIATGKIVARRPLFLKGVACKKTIPLPFPGEEFHAFCERHEDATNGGKVPARVYCVECEDAMCDVCFARDHDKRQAFRSHETRRIAVCSHCLVETATRECLHCGNGHVPFCDACFPHAHRAVAQPRSAKHSAGSPEQADSHAAVSAVPSKPLETHRFQSLVVMCIECASRVAQWRCETCQDVYCKRCLSTFHAKGLRQHHQCHRLSYFSVLKQLAEQSRDANALKELEKRHKQREEERKQRERELKLRNESATKIQALVRSFVARQHGKKYMRLVRQTQAAKAQRLKDEKVRSSILYKVKHVFGVSPALKSDTKLETVARQQRVEKIKQTLFLHQRVVSTEGSADPTNLKQRKKKKRWTKKKKTQVLQAARSWCVYGVRVKVTMKGEWKNSVGSILSTQNLLHTGFVVVFIPQANRSIVVNWEHIAPYDDDEFLRQPYEPPAHALFDAAHDFHAKLSSVVDAAARRAKLLYLQTVEFHDIAQFAWVVEFNKREGKEEFWNVVLNKRMFDVPRAMEQIERMEIEQRQAVEARVALAKSKLLDLLHPFQARSKIKLALRRNAVVYLPPANRGLKRNRKLKSDDDDVSSESKVDDNNADHVNALACARFWHDQVLVNELFGGKKALRFLTACSAAPHSTLDCWLLLKLWQWMDLYEADGYETQAKMFLSLASDLQLYIVDELKPILLATSDDGGAEQKNFREAKDKLVQLLKLKDETLQLLVFNAAQQRAAAEDAAAAAQT